ncbi:MAG: cadherin-like beta sandwich domain-containing protein [Eubacterium sp.]|nr:cadherin-like beta sandwich domain-containing protein [Eubacterium sp.]
MKLRRKISAMIVSICLILPLFCMPVLAASGSVSVSGASGNVGSTVSVNCTIKCSSGPIGAATVVASYDPSALQFVSATGGANGGSGSVIYAGDGDGSATSLSFSMSFKILKEGSHTVSAGSSDAYDWNLQVMSVSGGSGTIKGTVPQTDNPGNNSNNNNSNNNNNNNSNTNNNQDVDPSKDSNNKLSSLQVSPGSLSPAFSANTTSYTVTVPADTTAVTISATPASDKAKVSVSGGKDLKLGENSARVVVTAENGSSKAYNITIMCGEVEKITVNGTENTINEGFTDEQIPAGFSRGKAVYNEREYEALVSASGVQLMYLTNEAGSAFYIYEQDTQSFYPFVQIAIDEGKYIVPLPLDDTDPQFAGFEQVTLSIQNQSFFAWKIDEEFSVLKVMNQDGAELYYKYDSVDGTYQRFAEVKVSDNSLVIEGEIEEDDRPFYEKYSLYLIAGASGVAVLFLILTIVFGVKMKKQGKSAGDVEAKEKKEE